MLLRQINAGELFGELAAIDNVPRSQIMHDHLASPVNMEIAARVSTRREAVAREFKALDRGRLIERRRGAIALTDVDQLRRLIDEAIELG